MDLKKQMFEPGLELPWRQSNTLPRRQTRFGRKAVQVCLIPITTISLHYVILSLDFDVASSCRETD